MTSYFPSWTNVTNNSYTDWTNINVELREAAESEKPGWVTWFVNNTCRFVTRTVNTVTLLRNIGFFREIFAGIASASRLVAAFPTWKFNFHITSNPKVARVVFGEHRNGSGLFSTGGVQKSAFALLMESIFPALEISDEDNIMSCSEENTKRFRTFLHTKLTQNFLQSQIPVIEGIIKATLDRLEAASLKGPVELSSETKKFTAEIIGKLFLGYEGAYDELTNAIDVLIQRLGVINFTKKIPNPEELQASIDLVAKVIKEVASTSPENEKVTIITQMNQAGFSVAQVRAMVFMLFFAGQDTTANTLNYILLKLAQDQQLQEDVVSGELPIDCVIVEGLRMMPAAGIVARIAKSDLILTITNEDSGEKLTHYIEKSDRIGMAAMYASRDPQVVDGGENLDTFNPYRWKNKEIPSSLLKLSWFPFGDGVHMCPGSKVAHTEMKLLLEAILERFTLSTEVVGELRQKTVFTARVEGNIPIIFKTKA